MNEIEQKVAIWREKMANETITLDEMREAIQYLRNLRGKPIPKAEPAKKVKEIAQKPDIGNLLSKFLSKEPKDENPAQD